MTKAFALLYTEGTILDQDYTNMAIPDRETIKSALIQYILDHGGPERALRATDVYEGLAKHFALTHDDRAIKRGSEHFWENEIRWARLALVDDGYILPLAQSQWGVWKLTESASGFSPGASKEAYRQNPKLELEFPEIHSDLTDEGVFSPSSISDARDIALRAIVQRRGQHCFRAKLLSVYGFRCCVTEEGSIQVLEAAHIIPYKGKETNHIQNGLLLRSDLHTLFDLRLLAINPDYTIAISPDLKFSSYANFAGSSIHIPEAEDQQPSREALKNHRESCEF